MKKLKFARIYITLELSHDVARSQIFNWAELLEQKGLDCYYVVFYRNYDDLKIMIANDKDKKVFTKKICKTILIRELIVFFYLIILLPKFRCYHKIIFQTRVAGFVYPLIILKKISKKIRLIYESRAAGEDLDINLKKKFWGRFKYNFRKHRERLMLEQTSKIFVVSDYMKEYFLRFYKSNKICSDKFITIHGAADEESFYYSEEIRKKYRRKMHINKDQKVFIYSGGLSSYWQLPEKIFGFFKFINDTEINVRFVILTPDVNLAKICSKKYNIQNVIILHTEYEELNGFYNAADCGLLFREDVLMNNVASPTKYSEYILTGIPVIISQSIKDFKKITEENNFGYVIDNLEFDPLNLKGLLNFLSKMDFNNKENRRQISQKGRSILSKQVYLDSIIDVYKEV